MNFKGIAILLVISLVSDILLIQLNKSNPQLFSIFHKIPASWKGKWYIKWIFILIFLILSSIIQVSIGLSDIVGYIIAGIILSLCSFAFKKPQGE